MPMNNRYLTMTTNISRGVSRVQIAGALYCLITSLYYMAPMVRADAAAKSVAESEMDDWIPNSAAFDNYTQTWPPLQYSPPQRNTSSLVATMPKAQFGRAFHDGRLDVGQTLDLGAEDYKAVAVSFDSTGAPATLPPVHFHSLLKPAPIQTASTSASNLPFGLATSKGLHSYQQHSYTSSGRDSGYHYPVPQYQPPLPSSQYLPVPPVHSIEIPSEYQDPEHYYYFEQQHQHTSTAENGTKNQLEINTENRLFLQPGKCSNSIQVGRTRDVEVRTALKAGTQKGVCVLMLYTPNQLNKLAISLQAVQGTTNVIPTGTWLETNVKVYAIQAGDIQPIYTK